MAKVIAKLLDVSVRSYKKDGQDKKAADIVFKSGSDLMKATMFDSDVSKGLHMQYEQFLGKDVLVELSPEVFRGELQWRLGFADPKPIADKQSAPAKAVA